LFEQLEIQFRWSAHSERNLGNSPLLYIGCCGFGSSDDRVRRSGYSRNHRPGFRDQLQSQVFVSLDRRPLPCGFGLRYSD
jgi:hypothetical protein